MCLAADCQAPAYREGHVWEDSPSTIMMNISLQMSDFAPNRLICLAGVLKHKYSDRKEILVFMFSSYEAAKNFTAPLYGDSFKHRVNWSLWEHGSYSFDADKGEEMVYVMPFGEAYRSFNTVIKLPVTSIPPCRLEIASRCLLALNAIDYPWNTLKTRRSGAVTLEAAIARDGTITAVKSAGAGPSGQEQASLINAAIQNLKSWRFETASRRDTIRIVYSFTIDTSGTLGQPSLQFDLPDKVEIRGHLPQ
jgi:hypothetical protein